MDLSQLKTQVTTMFMMKAAQQKPGDKQHNPNSEIWSILYGMMVMNIVEYIFRHLPAVLIALQTWALAKWQPKQKAWLPELGKTDKEKEQIHSITMTRVFQKQTSDRETNVNVEKVDAVLDFICALDNAKHVRLDTRYTIGTTDDVQLTPDLKARVKQTSGGGAPTVGSNTDEMSTIEIVLFSSVLKLTDIRAWIDDIHKNYVFEKNNKLGNNIYYFNEIPHEPVVITDMSGDTPKKTYKWDNMPKTLTFNMNEFKTSKSFSNVYGNHVDELKERLDLFVNHPEWYADRGIPHSLGIMLHGIPGAGKTSTIKAIAKDTHRHIFNLSLRAFTTQKQLLNLFFNESVVVHKYDGSKTTYNIPINRRVYVIEDIDCMTDVTMDRALIQAQTQGQQGQQQAQSQSQPQEGAGDAITLSFLLNLLDGVLETPGRILVITSNYPEKLDKALVRPGRIDVKIEFKNASREFIREMVERFYSKPVALETIPPELDNVFTPAEVMESLCTYFKDADGAIKHMLQKRPKSHHEPCLKVQEIPTTSKQVPEQKEEKEQDSGTTLESLGISNSQQSQSDDKPINELVDTQPQPQPPQKTKSMFETQNLEGDVLSKLMACNSLTKPPPDSFLNAGIIVDEKEFANRFQYALDGKQMDASRAFTANPEFIPDTSRVSGYDVQGNNPSMWSDPNVEPECINPDSAECAELIAKKSADLQTLLSVRPTLSEK